MKLPVGQLKAMYRLDPHPMYLLLQPAAVVFWRGYCMKYTYAPGTKRAFRWNRDSDVRNHRPPKGWSADADITDIHPITGAPLERAEWWIIETKD